MGDSLFSACSYAWDNNVFMFVCPDISKIFVCLVV